MAPNYQTDALEVLYLKTSKYSINDLHISFPPYLLKFKFPKRFMNYFLVPVIELYMV